MAKVIEIAKNKIKTKTNNIKREFEFEKRNS